MKSQLKSQSVLLEKQLDNMEMVFGMFDFAGSTAVLVVYLDDCLLPSYMVRSPKLFDTHLNQRSSGSNWSWRVEHKFKQWSYELWMSWQSGWI